MIAGSDAETPTMTLQPTEARHPEARGLDALPLSELLATLHRADREAVEAVGRALPQIERAVEALVEGWEAGGRWVYVGAGTSGRLGALDAAELPPTFGVEPERVVAVIAGGPQALLRADEGAEDDAEAGRRAAHDLQLEARDRVIALSASGRTPFVLAFVEAARARRAVTIGITSVPGSPLARRVERPVVTETGPEMVAGSTRLKAGTAQKLVLNLMSTAAMVRLGRVYDGWMIDVRATNAKLRRRVRATLKALTGAPDDAIERALNATGERAKPALLMLRRPGLSAEEADRLLRQHQGRVREALRALGLEPDRPAELG